MQCIEFFFPISINPFLFSWRIRVRERLARDEPSHKSPNLGSATETPAYTQFPQSYPRYHSHGLPLPNTPAKQHHTHPGQEERHDLGGQSYFSMGSESKHKHESQEILKEAECKRDGQQDARAVCLLHSRKAVLPSEIRRKEKSTEDPRHGWTENMEANLRISGHGREFVTEDPRGMRGGWSRREVYTEHVSRRQAAESMYAKSKESQKRANATLHQQGSSSASLQTSTQTPTVSSSGRSAPGSSKPLTHCDAGIVQKTVSHQKPIQDSIHIRDAAPQEKVPNGDLLPEPKVSVAQLRHTYMKSVASPRKTEL